MVSVDLIPFGTDAQRVVERQWLAATQGESGPGDVRAVVRSSWERSFVSAIPPDLPRAPIVMDAGGLVGILETTDWLELARTGLREHERSFSGAGHILTLFDHEGRMLTAEGDPAALEGLAEINFRPGALWSEQVVGTNGPGTALATRTATYIVGAEHYCARWHPWHCAAVPLRELSTGQILGVLDISGFREHAHPHTMSLALALALAIEQSVAAREVERRYLAVTRLAGLTHQYPADAAVAVDRHGRILLASPSTPAALGPGRDHAGLRSLVMNLISRSRDCLPQEVEVAVSADDRRRGVWHPVLHGRTVVGGCLMLEHRGTVHGRHTAKGGSRGGLHHAFADIVGESPVWRRVRDTALAAAETDLPLLLVGEPGSGKEVLAQAVHLASRRRDRPFLAINCAALSREQADRELLGSASAMGRIEGAVEGTLFLDEIGELSAVAQTGLLHLLEHGVITRVGEAESQPADVRIIGATCRDLVTMVARGQLRSELYHRISIIRIELPPLRARGDDLTLLARQLFRTVARDLGRPEIVVDGDVFTAFQAYSWPGNVRELKNVVRRLMVVAGAAISVADLPQAIRAAFQGAAPPLNPEVTMTAPFSPASRIDREDARLMDVVNRSRTMAEAAAKLGITRSTLYRRMERFGLKPKRVVDRGFRRL